MSLQQIKISQDQTNQTYQIHFQTNDRDSTKIIIKSLFHSQILRPYTSTITDHYQTLIIKAETLTNMEDFLMNQYQSLTIKQLENKKYEIALKMMNDVMKQIQSLFHYKHTFYAFSLQHLFVLDNQHFIYLNPEYLLPLDTQTIKENPTITLKIPFQKEKPGLFLSPEIQEISQLPFSLSYKTIYYSLGSLIIYFLFEKEISCLISEDQTTQDYVKEMLKPIKETKLYWFLHRITKTDPAERWLHY